MAELEAGAGGDVGIVVLGLVPEFVGRGFGGELLTLATELAWSLGARACGSRHRPATIELRCRTTSGVDSACSGRSSG